MEIIHLIDTINKNKKQDSINKEADKLLISNWNSFKSIKSKGGTFGLIRKRCLKDFGVIPSFLACCYDTPEGYIKAKYE